MPLIANVMHLHPPGLSLSWSSEICFSPCVENDIFVFVKLYMGKCEREGGWSTNNSARGGILKRKLMKDKETMVSHLLKIIFLGELRNQETTFKTERESINLLGIHGTGT